MELLKGERMKSLRRAAGGEWGQQEKNEMKKRKRECECEKEEKQGRE